MSAESALSLSIKDSEVTLSFIADACSPASATLAAMARTRATIIATSPTHTGITPETKPTPEPCNCLVALRLGIFFVLYPAVISYLWFYYIPTRSIPK